MEPLGPRFEAWMEKAEARAAERPAGMEPPDQEGAEASEEETLMRLLASMSEKAREPDWLRVSGA